MGVVAAELTRVDGREPGRGDWTRPCLVMDIDGTLCPTKTKGQRYEDIVPDPEMVQRLRDYHAVGYYLIYNTGRNMRSFNQSVGLLTAHTVPVIIEWFRKHGIPYDELHVGRPWPGPEGFFVCDRTVTPQMFLTMSHQEINEWLATQGVPQSPAD